MELPTPDTTWALAQAKARLSEVIRASKFAPQIISTDGTPSAVVVSFNEYDNLMRLRRELILQRRRASLSALHEMNESENSGPDFILPKRTERPFPQLEDDTE